MYFCVQIEDSKIPDARENLSFFKKQEIRGIWFGRMRVLYSIKDQKDFYGLQ